MTLIYGDATKVTEVLADLILLAPPDERAALMADVLANLGQFVLEKVKMQHPNPIRVVAIDARGAARSHPLTERRKPLCSLVQPA